MCHKIHKYNLMLYSIQHHCTSPDWMNNWGGNWLNTYLELAPNTNIAALEKKFPAYLKKYMSEDNWKNYELFLLPLKDVHAGATDIGLDISITNSLTKVIQISFSSLLLIVLLIACINFMNLSTARSAERAREVGVRKSIGAHPLAIVSFSLSVNRSCLSFVAMILAIVLV